MTDRDRLRRVRGRGLGALAGRAGWNLADQAVSSATNLVLSVLAARTLSVEGFGAFAVAFTVYSFLIAGGRALIGRPLTVRYPSRGPESLRTASREAAGATVLLGIASGLVVGGVGLLLGGGVGSSLAWMGVLLPGLLLQDMWRLIFITEGRPRAAFLNDALWGLAQLGFFWVFIATHRQSSATLLVSWGGAALLVAVYGAVQFRGRPRIRASIPWLVAQRDLVKYYLASFIAIMGANQLTLLLIAGLGTPADLGALRAAQVVLGPLNLLGYALLAFAIPEISRHQLRGRRAIGVAAALSAVLLLADLVWGIALIALPDRAGEALLGDTWTSAQAVLPATLLGLVAIAVGFGANLLLTALGYAKATFQINCLLAPGFLVFGITGLELGGAPGAALGLSLAQVVVAPAMWWRVRTLMRQRAPQEGEPPVGAADVDETSVIGDPA